MSILLNPSFWFNLRPGSMSGFSRNIFIGLIVMLIVAGVLFFIAKKKKGTYRSLFSSLYNFCISNTFIAVLLLFFNYEVVPFFSAYFWYLLWVIIMIWWLINIILKLKKIIVRQKTQVSVDEITKYLP